MIRPRFSARIEGPDMRVSRPSGTHIRIEPRKSGVIIRQGTSWINLSADEVEPLFDAVRQYLKDT